VIRNGGDTNIPEGTVLSINAPRAPQTISVTRTFYNQNNGDYPDVDDRVFGHTIGKPSSYPSTPITSGLYIGPYSVGQGAGSFTATIELAEGSSVGTSWDKKEEASFEGGAGVKYGTSRAYSYGFTYEISNTKYVTYQGTVNNISDPGDLAKYKYAWGLCAYPGYLDDPKETFTVINYWVPTGK
jgi:hypothetical protein